MKECIGIFDSGVGGLTIYNEIRNILPDENIIYLGDYKYNPYGNLTTEKLLDRCKKIISWFIKQNAKLVVMACNTASTNIISEMRDCFDIPIIGVEPSIKPAALSTKTNNIGVLATKGTIYSPKFNQAKEIFTKNINVIEVIGEGIVSAIENGKLHDKETFELLKKYITPMLNSNVDVIVLGCTHYTYLIPILKKIVPKSIKIMDNKMAIAKQTKKVLEEKKLLATNKGSTKFYTTSTKNKMKLFINSKIAVVLCNL